MKTEGEATDLRDTQWICKTEPHCACIDHECEFTCECVKSPTNMRIARCRMCAAPLNEIDTETSEEISP